MYRDVLQPGKTEKIGTFFDDAYIQHNLRAFDGVEGLGKFLDMFGTLPSKLYRTIEDGDMVAVHNQTTLGRNDQAVFDVFRLGGGKIVEHWDALQPVAPANPSGHTQLDGPTEISDTANTEGNKAVVADFIQKILIEGQFDRIGSYFQGDDYTQHNSTIPDGVSGLQGALATLAKQGISFQYSKNHMVIGEGNFVLTLSEGEFAGKTTKFFDLFRLENGKIAEHWDVFQEIPPQEQWKNNNGPF